MASAGIMGSKQLQVRQGVELQFLVNLIGHFARINGMIDMVADQSGRVVIVSSSASIQQAPKKGSYSTIFTVTASTSRFFYGQSKLACGRFAKGLYRRLTSRGIAVNSLHPVAVGGTV